jgi:hypothetical protein
VGAGERNLLGSLNISPVFLFGFLREFGGVLEGIHILGFLWGLEMKIIGLIG